MHVLLWAVLWSPTLSLRSTVTVFTHGESGYPCIRTPSIVYTGKTLLAFAGTRCGSGDGCYPTNVTHMDHQDTVMKTSTDGGKTWSNLKAIYTGPCTDRNHGASLYDSVAGRVMVVLNGRNGSTFLITSDDEGQTWTSPKYIPLPGYEESRVSPGRGLQLSKNHIRHPSRILFVAQFGDNKGNIIYFSDDHGETWRMSSTIVPHCNEAQMVELQDGRVLLNARDETTTARRFAWSHDAGTTWDNITLVHYFDATHCMGSFLNTVTAPQYKLYYSHPNSLKGRVNGTVWMSNDDGISFPHTFQITTPTEHFAYSCLTHIPEDGSHGLLYETGDAGCSSSSASCRVVFVLVPDEF